VRGRSTVIAFLLVACNTSVEGTGASPDAGTGGPASTSAGTSGNAPASGGITAQIDGVWDITSAGDTPIGASQLTVSDGVVRGVLVEQDEGKTMGPGCTHTKARAEFELTFKGNVLSGTITKMSEWTGPSDCPTSQVPRPLAVTGSRPSARAGDLSGDWTVTVGDEPAFAVTVDDLLGRGWTTTARTGPPMLTATVANGFATVAARRSWLSFAARKRR
jgi:hypothetical protein